MPPRDVHNLRHIARLTVEMYRKNRLRPRRNGSLDSLRINIVITIRLDKDGGRAVHGNPHHTCDICVRRYNDFVAFFDSQQTKRNPKGIEPACKAHTIFSPDIVCPLVLESSHLIAQNIPS